MREQIIKALIAHAQGDIQKHVANVEVYLTNPAGIGEHSDVMEAIEHELNQVAKYMDQIEVIQKYIQKKNNGIRNYINFCSITFRRSNTLLWNQGWIL